MKYASIKDILHAKPINQKITLAGWLKTKRDSKAGLSFLELNDGSTLSNIQIVVDHKLPNYLTEIANLTSGASVITTGTIVASQGKNQAIEMQASSLEVIGKIDNPDTYPIQPKRHSFEYLREVAHLRPRTNTFGAITRLRSKVSLLIHQYLHDRGFVWVHTPIITSNDCEGAGDLFRITTLNHSTTSKSDFSKDFFGQETFLTVSGQLNVEAYCMALSKVYTFGPTFRAENSNTSRHLAEFWMIEPEIAFATLNDIAIFCEDMLKTLFKDVLSQCGEDMAFFAQLIDKSCLERLDQIIHTNFEMMTYTQAIDYLLKSNKTFEYPVKWGLDLQSEHERYLTEVLCKKPVILTDYPKEIKGFYMRVNDDGKTVAAMDVLVPGIGEIIGGSQREERYDILKQRMIDLNLNVENYAWYLDLRKYGSAPHSGFGLGLERLLGYISGLSNVRDLIPFPRTPNNAKF